MTAASSLFRSLIVYAVCVPLAVVLGYLMAAPFDFTTFTVLGSLFFLLATPLLLRWYHPWLIASWNMVLVLPFLPGRPAAWLALAWIGLGIAVGQYILNRQLKFLSAPPVTRPLLFMVVVVLVTAYFTGGIGLNALGSSVAGGRKYIDLLTAIAGYFAITSRRIPPHRAMVYVALYFLGALTRAVGELADFGGGVLSPLFMFFPVSQTGMRALTQGTEVAINSTLRIEGLTIAGAAVLCWMLSRYQLRELFQVRRLARLFVFLAVAIIGMFGGYRGALVSNMMTIALLAYLQGVARSPAMPLVAFVLVLCGAILSPFVDRLPFSVQRSLSFLPLNVSPIVRESAQTSSDWRIIMWKDLLPQVPQYLLLGKGYAFTPDDLRMASLSDTGNMSLSATELVGDYHNGPLSVILPFGIWGAIAWVWFLIGSVRVLRRNYLWGDPAYHRVNTFLLAYFLSKAVFFFVIFGALSSEIAAFAGLVALSISLNGGVAQLAVVEQPKIVFNRFKLHPTARPTAATP
jgi:hypothetical protein